jgi:hypothetical protein
MKPLSTHLFSNWLIPLSIKNDLIGAEVFLDSVKNGERALERRGRPVLQNLVGGSTLHQHRTLHNGKMSAFRCKSLPSLVEGTTENAVYTNVQYTSFGTFLAKGQIQVWISKNNNVLVLNLKSHW